MYTVVGKVNQLLMFKEPVTQVRISQVFTGNGQEVSKIVSRHFFWQLNDTCCLVGASGYRISLTPHGNVSIQPPPPQRHYKLTDPPVRDCVIIEHVFGKLKHIPSTLK